MNNFKWQKFSLRLCLSFCLIFYQFQPGVAYKSVAYKKNQVFQGKIQGNIQSNKRINTHNNIQTVTFTNNTRKKHSNQLYSNCAVTTSVHSS